MGRSMSRIDLKTLEIDLAGRDRPDSCSRSSCATTTMIVLIARSSWRHRCQVRRYRMATSLADRSWAAFTTSMRGRHERCTYAALQRSGSVMRVDGPWLTGHVAVARCSLLSPGPIQRQLRKVALTPHGTRKFYLISA